MEKNKTDIRVLILNVVGQGRPREVTLKPIYFLFHHQHSIKPLQGPLIKSGKALGIRKFTVILSIIV